MRRMFILGTIVVGLLVAFGVAGEGGLQTARRAEAVESTTTWMYPTSGGIQVGAGPSEGTAIFVPAACTNCYITRIVPDLVYQNDPDPINHPDGTTANFNNSSLHNAWLHHMVVINSCNISSRVFASGNERSIWSAPASYGYSQTCATGWHVNYHIHNNSSATRGVALKLVVTYRTGETLTPVTPIWLDMSNTGTSEYTVPEGYSDTHTGSGASGISSDWTSTIQGAIVSMGGHVHDYGISVSAYNNRLGDYICTSTAGYGTGSRYLPTGGGPGTPGHPAAGNAVVLNQSYHEAAGSPDDRYHIQAMTGCAPTSAQAILCVGDVLRLHTQYNNSSSFPIFDAMGIISAQVATNLPDTNSNGTIDACDDSDSDGLRNSADNCPDWANPLQDMPLWTVSSGDTDCDGYHPTTSFGARAPEPSIGTVANQHCSATPAISDEPLPDAWPPDFNDNQLVNISDILAFNAVFGSTQAGGPPYTPRKDLNASGLINVSDVLQLNPFMFKRCSP